MYIFVSKKTQEIRHNLHRNLTISNLRSPIGVNPTFFFGSNCALFFGWGGHIGKFWGEGAFWSTVVKKMEHPGY